MSQPPKVSVIIIFLNTETYLEEAIQSVVAQSYPNWELLLVDDGSTDDSTEIAHRYARQKSTHIYYYEHPHHQNLGKSPSRNLGIRRAKGKYIAFLDADDIWLPKKLEEQVALLSSYPEVGMTYGNTLYWYSWQKSADKQDYMPPLGVPHNSIWPPPTLLRLFIRGKAAVPCTCSLLIEREIAQKINGFDESCMGISNIYEDQAFYAKVCLSTIIHVSDNCWDRYRQHAESSMSLALTTGEEQRAREHFLKWLVRYMQQEDIQDRLLHQAIKKELWMLRYPFWLSKFSYLSNFWRWGKKWILRIEEWFVPASISTWLWVRE